MKQKVLFVVAAVVLLLAFAVGAWVYENRAIDEPAQLTDPIHAQLVRMHSLEFIDPACEACASFYPKVKQIVASNPDEIRLVLRYAPFHKGSGAVVAVLEAAKKQGKFWPALEAVLASQASWTHNHVVQVNRVWKHLEGLGLDFEQMRADMVTPAIARAIAQDLDDAKALNVNKTPSFFVNGQPLLRFGYEPLKALVDGALGSAASPEVPTE
jgi:protein-disulfide isomerase